MDQIDQIRSKIDIVELINSYVPLKKSGRNFKALCPFHSEKTPSFIVSPERQIFKCFGCGVGGDVFKFLMEYEKMTFSEALRFLADKAGIKLKRFRPSAAQQEKERLLTINHLASEFYHFILLNHPIGKKGLDYLLKRGIRRSSIQLFKLGYAPNSWDNLIRYLVGKKGYNPADLEKAGLIIKKRYDRFRGRIIFPLTDNRGNVLGFSGRTLKPDLKGAKYINTPETTLYHKGELLYGLTQTKEFIKKADFAVVVEGEIDVISSYQAGVKNVVAIKGSALTENQVNLIKRFTSNITLALDADLAGDVAVKRGIEIADFIGLNIRIAQPKYGKDPDECARHSPTLWRKSVARAIPVFDFYLKSAVSRFNKDTAEGKKKISEELIPIMAKITNEVIKAHYLKKLADILEVSEEAVIKEVERVGRLERITPLKVAGVLSKVKKPKDKTRREKLEEFLLSLLLQNEKQISNLIEQISIKYFVNPVVKKIISYLKKFLSEKNKFEINKFAQELPEELIETLDQLYLQDLGSILKDEDKFLREFEKTKKEVEKLYLKDKLSKLTQKIRDKEKKGIKKGLQALREKFSFLSKRLKDLS